jgi:hypothetical protein
MMQQRLFIFRERRAPGLPCKKGCLTLIFETASFFDKTPDDQ